MHLTRRPGPAHDPFFAALRRRHPDIDLVLLPPEAPAAADHGPPLSDPVVEAERARVSELAGRLWAEAGCDTAVRPDTVLALGPGRGTVQPRARVVTRTTSEGTGVLGRLRTILTGLGWHVTVPEVGLMRLVAEQGPDRLRASYAEDPGTLVVELTAAPSYVGQARARAMVRASR